MSLSLKDTIQGTITNAQNAVTADTAGKLSVNAGSTTQPVYFSGGKPVATSYTLAKSVPADAKFTDTDTWRGIQNNLTSDSTTDSLSAAQGKVLKGLVDGKAASGHTHDDRYYTESEMNTKLNGKSNIGHTHSSIVTVGDTRSTATKPNDYSNCLTFCGMKSNSAIGNPSDDTYSYILGLRGWAEESGGYAHEIAFNNTGVYVRSGASTTWGNWQRVYTTGYKPSKSDVGLGNVDNTADSAKSVNYANSAGAVAWDNVTGKPSTYTPSSHTHSYAGAASSGGSATSAVKLDTSTAGSATQPVYFTGGKPAACTYTLGKSVPSNAKFTDTTYSAATSSTLGLVKVGSNISNSYGTISLTKANVTSALGYTPPTTNTTYGNATTGSSGLMSSSDKSKLDGIATGANKTVVDNALSQGSANPVANSAITKRLQYLYSFKISRDKWNESSDKSNWNVIVPWSDSKGTAITATASSATPNLTTNMSLGPAMMERTNSLKDNIILSGELSMINQGQIYVCDTNKLFFTVKRRPVCDLMLYFYARQWTT